MIQLGLTHVIFVGFGQHCDVHSDSSVVIVDTDQEENSTQNDESEKIFLRFLASLSKKFYEYLCWWNIETKKAIQVQIIRMISDASSPQGCFLTLSKVKSGKEVTLGKRSCVKAKLVVVATQAKTKKMPAIKVFKGSPRICCPDSSSVSSVTGWLLPLPLWLRGRWNLALRRM